MKFFQTSELIRPRVPLLPEAEWPRSVHRWYRRQICLYTAFVLRTTSFALVDVIASYHVMIRVKTLGFESVHDTLESKQKKNEMRDKDPFPSSETDPFVFVLRGRSSRWLRPIKTTARYLQHCTVQECLRPQPGSSSNAKIGARYRCNFIKGGLVIM